MEYVKTTARQRKDKALKNQRFLHVSKLWNIIIDPKTGLREIQMSKGVTYRKPKDD